MLAILRNLSKNDTSVKYLSFPRNFGKKSAIHVGFCYATSDCAAVMNADMQEPPSLLPEMVKLLKSKEYDSVATIRVTRGSVPSIRSFSARKFYQLMNYISDVDVVDDAGVLWMMRRKKVDAIVSMSEYNRFFQRDFRMERIQNILASV